MSKFLFCIVILFNGFQAQSENLTSFTNEELETLSPFEADVQQKVLRDVIRLMNEEIDPAKAVPLLRASESIGEEETNIIQASESQGMPGWALAKGVNIFLMDLNIILLGQEMKLHNLAHEYAHYVQMNYKKIPKEDFAMDYVEMQAVDVQNYFRD